MEPTAQAGALRALALLPLLVFLPLVVSTLLSPLRVRVRARDRREEARPRRP